MSNDFRDQLLTWLALREQQLKKSLKEIKNQEDFYFIKGELDSVMNTTAFILTEGKGY